MDCAHFFFQKAYVELLDTPALFESMYTEDAEGQKLNGMPDVDSLLVRYPLDST